MTTNARTDAERPLARLLDHPIWCAVAGGLLGVAVSAVLLATGLPAAPGARPAPSPSGVDAFIQAWQTHLSSSWSVDELERRTSASGAILAFRIHEAQRPPDSVNLGAGTVSARRGQLLIACATPPGQRTAVCREAPTTESWAAGVARQVGVLRAALTGRRAVYAVSALGHGCFELTLTGAVEPLPVFLDRGARYCFDPATHAVSMSTIRRVGATDTTVAVTARAPATDADLALPAGARYQR